MLLPMPALPRVLVVDDNPGDLTLLTEAITESQVPLTVTTCTTAQQALEVVGRDPSYALILSDINMPGMSGVEFLQSIARHPRAGTIPIVLMSSSTRDALPAGLSGSLRQVPYFTKPSDWQGFRTLARCLETVVRECGTSEDAGEALGAFIRPSGRLPTSTSQPARATPSARLRSQE